MHPSSLIHAILMDFGTNWLTCQANSGLTGGNLCINFSIGIVTFFHKYLIQLLHYLAIISKEHISKTYANKKPFVVKLHLKPFSCIFWFLNCCIYASLLINADSNLQYSFFYYSLFICFLLKLLFSVYWFPVVYFLRSCLQIK